MFALLGPEKNKVSTSKIIRPTQDAIEKKHEGNSIKFHSGATKRFRKHPRKPVNNTREIPVDILLTEKSPAESQRCVISSKPFVWWEAPYIGVSGISCFSIASTLCSQVSCHFFDPRFARYMQSERNEPKPSSPTLAA